MFLCWLLKDLFEKSRQNPPWIGSIYVLGCLFCWLKNDTVLLQMSPSYLHRTSIKSFTFLSACFTCPLYTDKTFEFIRTARWQVVLVNLSHSIHRCKYWSNKRLRESRCPCASLLQGVTTHMPRFIKRFPLSKDMSTLVFPEEEKFIERRREDYSQKMYLCKNFQITFGFLS